MEGKGFPFRPLAIFGPGIVLFLILRVFFATPPFQPLNAFTLQPLKGFSTVSSPLAYIFEPFIGLPAYLASLYRPGSQFLSCLVWMSFGLVFYYGAARIRAVRRLLRQIVLAWAAAGCACLYILFVPFPAVRLVPPDGDTVLLDVHSHTYFSHDGLASPWDNVSWHLRHNFSAWFITDHWGQKYARITAERAEKTPPYPTVIQGEEVSDDRGDYYLILGGRMSFSGQRWLSLKDLIDKAHSSGGLVIASHWWERDIVLKNIVSEGVDGIEIANGGHRSFPERKRQEVIEISGTRPMILLAASDWHGWGSYCWTWNAVRIPGWNRMNTEEKCREIISSLKEGQSEIIPILLGRKEIQGPWRIVFSPFVCAFYYLSSLHPLSVLSWIVWIVFTALAVGSRIWPYVASLVTTLGGIFFMLRGGLYLLSAPQSHSALLVPVGLALALAGGGLLFYSYISMWASAFASR